MIGSEITDLDLVSGEHDVYPLSSLLQGAEACLVIFCPFTYGDFSEGTMEHLLIEINDSIDEFNKRDIRVACITRLVPIGF
jgi:hypothetical protein